MLLPPALLLVRSHTTGAWATWRRAVLPFLLAACVMWFVIAASGSFNWLKGQFLITLFVLGSWLFALDRTPAVPGSSPSDCLAEPPAAPTPEPPSLLPPIGRPATSTLAKSVASAGSQSRLIVAGLAAIGLSLLGSWLLLALPAERFATIAPLAGIAACLGPLVLALRAPDGTAGPWLVSLGYAATIAFCLVPGLAIFVPVLTGTFLGWDLAVFFGRVLEPLYMGDTTFAAMTVILLLGLDRETIASRRRLRHLVIGLWAVWLAWVMLSGPGR